MVYQGRVKLPSHKTTSLNIILSIGLVTLVEER
jgi:hypothetical protein